MSASSRIVGLDIARSLAIIGMVVLHMASLVWHTKVILNGLPAALFAILAGITLMIIARNFTVTTLLRILARGCIITLIGLALLPLGGEIQVVLVVIGITMMLLCWVPPLHWAWKLILFAAATVAATVKYAPLTLPQVYPLLAYIAYFFAGMLLYEIYIRKLRAAAQWASTAIAGIVAAIGFYFRFTTDIPGWLRFTGHTGVVGEIVLSIAVAAVVLHLCLLAGRAASKLVYPFAALGAMSLSIYILHVLTAYYWQSHIALHNTAWACAFIALFLVIATLWRRLIGKGPAEWAVAKAIAIAVPAGKKD
ncbi:MAG: DUF418 domain-containing protein [Corynebacterium sp.]|uniref:DUF418 domain-containing protein n=1 Tax=Corynebacterium sp. TaxID=1720 RepID=UPI00280AC25D|nr:DUF418 domain-containing protein [Corynebacterium sp.]MDU3166137.1 DUF418 domain-containing protein [Corynebacterium sp.]MDU5328897.1 DUF418 domain-containing protein [Corynebacterium sp.]MDU6418410.1 DUF418 domain-containing protein [Corynebacterium sp.]MDU6592039.1 DUF418 domain-containing protein [Corynebacterium sp.]MDU7738118.1 DUF418 domain-containing protein [Corynebacterium sp.]